MIPFQLKLKPAMRRFIVPIIFSLYAIAITAQPIHYLRDEKGRHVVGRGFVVTTNDGGGEVFFKPDDYRRMARLGAEWQASWIWQKGEMRGTNSVLLARKRFNVETQPEEAKLFITADTYYELYVNGLFVNRGPARCAPHHQSYDILDIASTLKVGENVMSLRVFHKGRGTFNATATARPGILAQLEIQGKGNQQIITSNSSWKVKEPEGIYLYTSDFGESKDFREEESQWKEKDFDDSHWGEAKELINETFWPKPSPGERARTITYPWLSLVPRDIPYLIESMVKATRLHEVGEILEVSYSEPVAAGAHGLIFPIEKNTVNGFEAYKAGEGTITINNRYPVNTFSSDGIYSSYLIFDLGELMHGYPHLELEGEAGTIVEILYAPHLLGGRFPLRTNIGRRPLTDRIILKKGKTVWDALEIRDVRYILMAFRNTEKPVSLDFAGLKKTDYPFESLGSFSVPNDPDIEWLWQASVNTVNAVTTDAYVDNYREEAAIFADFLLCSPWQLCCFWRFIPAETVSGSNRTGTAK